MLEEESNDIFYCAQFAPTWCIYWNICMLLNFCLNVLYVVFEGKYNNIMIISITQSI